MFEDVITYDDTVYEHACYGTCQLWAEKVDVYYWPKPGANTSCLDIVGDKIDPINYGGTKTHLGIGAVQPTPKSLDGHPSQKQ